MNFLQKILGFLPFFGTNEYRVLAHNLYVSMVVEARNPTVFKTCEIEDTVDGRFDVIVLHLSLLLRRMKQAKETASLDDAESLQKLSEELIDVYHTDMDRNLREIGVGDMSVGKHVKKMAKAFYGRLLAYDEALSLLDSKKDNSLLSEALKRNIYRGKVTDVALAKLLSYVEEHIQHLNSVDADSLLKGLLPQNKVKTGG